MANILKQKSLDFFLNISDIGLVFCFHLLSSSETKRIHYFIMIIKKTQVNMNNFFIGLNDNVKNTKIDPKKRRERLKLEVTRVNFRPYSDLCIDAVFGINMQKVLNLFSLLC